MKKKLKLAILLFPVMVGVNAYAQKRTTSKPTKPKTESTAAKPTKAETMDWIGGKMKENLGQYREVISYESGKFIYKRPYLNGHCLVTIDLNKVTGMSNEYSEDFYIMGKDLIKSECDNVEETKSNNQEVSISGPNYDGYSAPFNFTPDQALVARLRKAFATLIEYNSSKKADEKF